MKTNASQTEYLLRGVNRRTDYLQQHATFIENEDHYLEVLAKENEKKIILRFLRSPVELTTNSKDPAKIGAVRL